MATCDSVLPPLVWEVDEGSHDTVQYLITLRKCGRAHQEMVAGRRIDERVRRPGWQTLTIHCLHSLSSQPSRSPGLVNGSVVPPAAEGDVRRSGNAQAPLQHPWDHLIRRAVAVGEGLDVDDDFLAHLDPAFDGG